MNSVHTVKIMVLDRFLVNNSRVESSATGAALLLIRRSSKKLLEQLLNPLLLRFIWRLAAKWGNSLVAFMDHPITTVPIGGSHSDIENCEERGITRGSKGTDSL